MHSASLRINNVERGYKSPFLLIISRCFTNYWILLSNPPRSKLLLKNI
jgi:hypothetical protein